MKNEEKTKVCLEKMLTILRSGLGRDEGGDTCFYNPILAGMEIERIRLQYKELFELLAKNRITINECLVSIAFAFNRLNRSSGHIGVETLYSPVLAGMEIERIWNDLEELVELLGYQEASVSSRKVVLTKIKEVN